MLYGEYTDREIITQSSTEKQMFTREFLENFVILTAV